MRIGIISSTQKPSEEIEKRTRILSGIVAGCARLDIIESGSPLKQLQTREDHRMAMPYMVEAAKREEGRYGAYIIGCLGDAGFDEVRRATSTPVIPPSRSTYLMAATMFDRIAVLVNNEEGAGLRKKTFKEMGIDGALSEVIVTGMAPLDYVHSPDDALKRVDMLVAGRKDRNVSAVIPTCASLAILLEERGIQNMHGLRVVNPLRIAIRMAEVICGS
jgi:Asp/Glu/hydantoin racemase